MLTNCTGKKKIYSSIDEAEYDFAKEIAKSMQDNLKERKNKLNQTAKIPERIQVLTTVFKRNSDMVAQVL